MAREQIENSFLPIVVLSLDSSTRLVVENIGLGPALNIHDIFIHGHDATVLLYHASSLRPAQAEQVGVFKGDESVLLVHQAIEATNIDKELKRLFPTVAGWPGEPVCIGYEDANTGWHETHQSIWFSRAPELKGMHGIVLRFDKI